MLNNEEILYPKIADWLRTNVGCQYVGIRKSLWGKQPDVLGIKFSKEGNGYLKAELHLAEVKIVDSLASGYNLIGEVEVKIALFKKRSSAFHSLFAYLAIFEDNYNGEEIREYAFHRRIGIIKFENHKGATLVLEMMPTPIFLNKVLSINKLWNKDWIKDKDEAKVFEEAVKKVGWWRLKNI